MAPPRAFWKGYLKLSLVSCPIALYTGTSATERVSFRQINKKTGNRLRQQLVDEVTREPVEGEDKGRATMFVTYWCLAYAVKLSDKLGAMGIDAITRIVGFFVAAMGVALIFDGVIEALETHGVKSLH